MNRIDGWDPDLICAIPLYRRYDNPISEISENLASEKQNPALVRITD